MAVGGLDVQFVLARVRRLVDAVVPVNITMLYGHRTILGAKLQTMGHATCHRGCYRIIGHVNMGT